MSDDLTTQLHQLQNLRKLGVLDEETYHKGLATLRIRYGGEAVDVLLGADLPVLPPRVNAQVIGGSAQVGVAVTGGFPARSD